jgi:hypothetical protein
MGKSLLTCELHRTTAYVRKKCALLNVLLSATKTLVGSEGTLNQARDAYTCGQYQVYRIFGRGSRLRFGPVLKIPLQTPRGGRHGDQVTMVVHESGFTVGLARTRQLKVISRR